MANSLSVRCVFALFLAAILLPLSTPAQIEIELVDVTNQGKNLSAGSTAPVPVWGKWLAGDPVVHGKGGVTVYGFYTGARAASLGADGDYLSELQRRFADRPLWVVAVVGEDTEVPGHITPCHVVTDAGAATTQAWLGADPGVDNVLVLDGDAVVTYRGQPGHGVVDAIERALNGKPKVEDQQRARLILAGLESNFDSMVGAAAKGQAETVLAHAPRDGRALALAYLAHATKLYDAEAAAAQRELAVGRLANESRPLAVYADLALRGQPQSRELALQLAAALEPATAAAPNDPIVQLAYLRALVLSGKSRQVGRQAMLIRKLAFVQAATSLAFCEILTQAEMPQVHRDLCEQAIQKAEALGAAPRQLTALRYVVARRCAEDDEAAKAIVDKYAVSVGVRSSINNDCWYFMTDLRTMGRHNVFAAALAEKMLEERKQMDSFEFDTAALAMFLAGRISEAVELQEAAMAKGAQGNAEYIERLQRYQAAAAAEEKTPAKDKKPGK